MATDEERAACLGRVLELFSPMGPWANGKRTHCVKVEVRRSLIGARTRAQDAPEVWRSDGLNAEKVNQPATKVLPDLVALAGEGLLKAASTYYTSGVGEVGVYLSFTVATDVLALARTQSHSPGSDRYLEG